MPTKPEPARIPLSPLRFPPPVEAEAMHLMLGCTLHSRDDDERVRTLCDDATAAALAYEVGRDLRNRASLASDLVVVSIARCYSPGDLAEGDWGPSFDLGAMLERIYAANEQLRGLRFLGLGKQAEQPIEAAVAEDHLPAVEYPVDCVLLLPVYVVGPSESLAKFRARLYAKPEIELPASDRTRAALARHFGLAKDAVEVATYVPDMLLDEVFASVARNGDFALICESLLDDRQEMLDYGQALVFTDKGKALLPFFTFDRYAEGHPEVGEDQLADEYLSWLVDFRELMERLGEGGAQVRVVEGSVGMDEQNDALVWQAKESASPVGDFLVELSRHADAHHDDTETEIAAIVLGFCELEDEGVIYGVLGKEDAKGRLIAQDNLFPITLEGITRCIEYAQAEAARLGLILEKTDCDEIQFCPEHRALLAPIASHGSSDAESYGFGAVKPHKFVH
jgi:hypothetical protein